MTQLSKNFSLAEFTKSQTALRKGIRNVPNSAHIGAMTLLCATVLEPVRAHFGRPVAISSGFRCAELNRAVGGSATGSHPRGEAADFEISGISNYEVAKWIEKNLSFDQLILECYTPGQPNSGWIHVSYRAPCRKQSLTFDGRRYLDGLAA